MYFLQPILNELTCAMCTFHKAFDHWSSIKWGDFILWGMVIGTLDFFVHRWYRISTASEGNVSTSIPIPRTILIFKYEHLHTRDARTEFNLYHLFAAIRQRLRHEDTSKLNKFPEIHFYHINELSNKTFR